MWNEEAKIIPYTMKYCLVQCRVKHKTMLEEASRPTSRHNATESL